MIQEQVKESPATERSAGVGSLSLSALPVPRGPVYQSLDVWRGIACLAIVVYHSSASYRRWGSAEESAGAQAVHAILDALWLGVPMFFVISGYCIAATIDATRRRPFYLRNYLRRRCRRIYPPYWVSLVLLSAALLVCEWGSLQSRIPSYTQGWFSLTDLGVIGWAGNLTLTDTWLPYLTGHDSQAISRIAWSLCYEQQFYLICFLVLAVCPRRFFLGTGAVSGILGLVLVAALLREGRPVLYGTFLDGRWLQFALGLILYWQLNYGPRWSAMAFAVGLAAAVGVIVTVGIARPSSVQAVCGNCLFELVLCAGFTLLLLLLRRWDGWLAERSWLRPLAYCGLICYSLYLIHWPFCKVVCGLCWGAGVHSLWGTLLITVPVGIGVSVLAATAFFLVVERRFMNCRTTTVPAR